MASGGWRIVVSAILLILLVEESAAKRISSSRRGHRKNALSLGLGPFRAQQANEVDDDIGGGDTTTITSNSQTSVTTLRSSFVTSFFTDHYIVVQVEQSVRCVCVCVCVCVRTMPFTRMVFWCLFTIHDDCHASSSSPYLVTFVRRSKFKVTG